jgi:hypothetical protein
MLARCWVFPRIQVTLRMRGAPDAATGPPFLA